MKLGIISDIHEDLANLELALAACDAQEVDKVVCLGDVFQKGDLIHETIAILAERKIEGVWGNHDFGLCSHPSALVSSRRAQFAGPVLDYFGTFRPSFEIENCLFSHVEPWRDLNDVMGLWYLGGLPDTPEKAGRSFEACPNRIMFTGHHHRWLVAKPDGTVPWDGRSAIRLESPHRFLVVVAAVCEGYCGIYDTATCELSPIALRDFSLA